MYADSADWQYSAKAGCEYAGYSNELASSPSSTAFAVPLLPHGRRLLAIKNGAIVWCDSPVCGLFGFSAFVAEVAPLDGCFAAGPVVDLVGGFGFFFLWDEEVVVDFVVVGGVCEDPVCFFELVADGALVGVVGGDGEGFVASPGGDVGGFEAGNGALGVGADEAAGAEFDAAKVADYGTDNVSEAFFFEDFEHGYAGGAGGFAVIGEAHLQATTADDPCGAYVGGLRVQVFEFGNKGAGIVFGVYGHGVADEARFFDYKFIFAVTLNAFVFVRGLWV